MSLVEYAKSELAKIGRDEEGLQDLCSTISELSITEKEGDEPMTVKLVNEVGMQNIGRYKTGRWYGRVCEDGKQ